MNESIRTPASHETTTLAPDAAYGTARNGDTRAGDRPAGGVVPSESHRPAGHPPVKNGRIGVLIVNLGTPDGTDAESVKKYLKEFLSDRRVIEETGLIWKLVLNGIILRTRPAQKGRDYEKIWNTEKNESPLKTITRSQSDLLAAALAPVDGRLLVDWAMRYGNPSIESRLAALQAEGCDRILVVPLYPQYAAATTATVCDETFRALMRMRWQPTLRVAHPWYDDPVYIDALARSIEAELAKLSFVPDVLIASFHGIPKEYFDKGDPYYCHCAKTHRLLRARLGMDEDRFRLTFQSRFGRAEWLQPYTDMTVKALAESGVKNLAVVTPGFTSDCLETLEEIAGENAEIFHHGGGENFAALPCLNDSPAGMDVIRNVVLRELKGWVDG
ncbi:ferrochelatase [Rhodoplanes sp. SY1]|uniref:ferrochelatase n=1 Tax=Rhodoplanes sp. SY1 TaxID=3166646 RepID=UPI0038B60E47